MTDKSTIWILNYKPTISNLKINKKIKNKIKNFVGVEKQIPFNLLLNGASGVGKLTIIKAILNEVYNIPEDKPDILSNLKEYHNIPFLFHYQNIYFVNFNLVRTNNEIDTIITKLKKISGSKGLDLLSKVFVLLHIDNLGIRHQINLSIIIEKYINNIKILCTSNSFLRVIPKLKGLISCIRIPILEDKLFLFLVRSVFKNNNIIENVSDFSTNKKLKSNVLKIFINNQKSIKSSLLMIQNIYTEKKSILYKPSFLSKKIIKLFDYLDKVNFTNLSNIRTYIFHLLGIGFKPNQIFHKLIDFIGSNKMIDDSKKLEIVELFAENDISLTKCDRDFYVMENSLFKLLLILNK